MRAVAHHQTVLAARRSAHAQGPVHDIEIDHLIEGDGPETIVMVNGLADEKECWGYQTPDLLAAGYRVVTFDNRGVGQSSKPPARTRPGSSPTRRRWWTRWASPASTWWARAWAA